MLDPTAPQPLYLQLADLLRNQISSGALKPRTAIPSLSQLSVDHDIAVVTVQKALQILKDEGLLLAVPGKGTFVR